MTNSSASLITSPLFYETDQSNNPLAGGKVYSYQAGNPTLSYVGGIAADPGLTGATYQNIRVRRCWIQNTWCQGIGFNNVVGGEISDNTIYLCGCQANTQSPTNNHGIMLGTETTSMAVGVSNVQIRRNHVIGIKN